MATRPGSLALKQWLTDNGRTQMWLANELGVSQTAVSAWILGSEPRASVAARLEALTGISVASWGEVEQSADDVQGEANANTGTHG